jgi:hypothetical protein
MIVGMYCVCILGIGWGEGKMIKGDEVGNSEDSVGGERREMGSGEGY